MQGVFVEDCLSVASFADALLNGSAGELKALAQGVILVLA